MLANKIMSGLGGQSQGFYVGSLTSGRVADSTAMTTSSDAHFKRCMSEFRDDQVQ